MIVIDSLNGYLNAMPEERFLTIQLHELLMHLGQRGVATILIGAHQGIIGTQMQTPVDASYSGGRGPAAAVLEPEGRSAAGAVGRQEARRRYHERTIRNSAWGRPASTSEKPCDLGVLTGCPSTKARAPSCHERASRG